MRKQSEEIFDRLSCSASEPLEPPVQSLRTKRIREPGIITFEKTSQNQPKEDELPDGLDIAKDDVEAVIHKEKPRTSLYTITFREPQYDAPSKLQKSKLLKNDRLLKSKKEIPHSFPKTPKPASKKKHIKPTTRTFQEKKKKTKPRLSSIRNLSISDGSKKKQIHGKNRSLSKRRRLSRDIPQEDHVVFQPSLAEQISRGISYAFRAIMNWFIPMKSRHRPRSRRREYLRRIKMRKRRAERERRKAQEDRKQRQLEQQNEDETDDQLQFYSPVSSYHHRSQEPIASPVSSSYTSALSSQFRKNTDSTFLDLSHDRKPPITSSSSIAQQRSGEISSQPLGKIPLSSKASLAPSPQLPQYNNEFSQRRPGSIRYNNNNVVLPSSSSSSSSPSPLSPPDPQSTPISQRKQHQQHHQQHFPQTPDPSSTPTFPVQKNGMISNTGGPTYYSPPRHQNPYMNQHQHPYPYQHQPDPPPQTAVSQPPPMNGTPKFGKPSMTGSKTAPSPVPPTQYSPSFQRGTINSSNYGQVITPNQNRRPNYPPFAAQNTPPLSKSPIQSGGVDPRLSTSDIDTDFDSFSLSRYF